MNTLIEGYLVPQNDFQSNHHLLFPPKSHGFGYKLNPKIDGFFVMPNGSSPVDESSSEGEVSQDFSVPTSELFTETDQNATLNFISQMLMEEEDLENKPCMLYDYLALQATEQSLYDVLKENHDENDLSPNSCRSSSDIGSCVDNCNHEGDLEHLMANETDFQSFGGLMSSHLDLKSRGRIEEIAHFLFNDEFPGVNYREITERNKGGFSPNDFRGHKKNHFREGYDLIDAQRNYKQVAKSAGESDSIEMYDDVLLCSDLDRMMPSYGESNVTETRKESISKRSNRGRPRRGRKEIKEVVDMRSLLIQCAQAVASYDSRTVNDLLTRIRKHSSSSGDGTERLAHYFADALEARMAGTGPASYAGFLSTRISAAGILKAYQTFIKACPFKKMSDFLANRTILKLTIRERATTVHIIDFGILYGYQWPCLIQRLSEIPDGPPKLRITGIDFPQPGFRPAERVADTGARLKKYCERFGVPFEFNVIAKKWETIKIEDLKIEKHELLVVNSLYRLQNVPDETIMANSPRDTVLNLIRRINPSMFIHGTINGTFNTPFFVTRFREALFHYSSMFDMFETTVSREDQHRVLFEKEVFGKDLMNIIACEGTERVERPETYKQWQVRFQRAGFKQMSLDQEIVKFVRYKVKTDYNKDFSVDEDGKWMLQGWKGRVNHVMSFWRLSHK